MKKNEILAQIRKLKGYSSEGAARRLKISASKLSRFENGHSKRNRLIILDLMELYGLPEYVKNIIKKDIPSDTELNILKRYISKL